MHVADLLIGFLLCRLKKWNSLDEEIGNFIYDKGIIMLLGWKVDASAILYAQEFAAELNFSFM